MSLENEIRKHTGVTIVDIPKDGISRSFRVGSKQYFAISFDGCGSFGCMASGEVYGWSGEKAWPINFERKSARLGRKAIDVEQKIIDIGDMMYEKGLPMDDQALDRYILALTRVIEFNGKQTN